MTVTVFDQPDDRGFHMLGPRGLEICTSFHRSPTIMTHFSELELSVLLKLPTSNFQLSYPLLRLRRIRSDTLATA